MRVHGRDDLQIFSACYDEPLSHILSDGTVPHGGAHNSLLSLKEEENLMEKT